MGIFTKKQPETVADSPVKTDFNPAFDNIYERVEKFSNAKLSGMGMTFYVQSALAYWGDIYKEGYTKEKAERLVNAANLENYECDNFSVRAAEDRLELHEMVWVDNKKAISRARKARNRDSVYTLILAVSSAKTVGTPISYAAGMGAVAMGGKVGVANNRIREQLNLQEVLDSNCQLEKSWIMSLEQTSDMLDAMPTVGRVRLREINAINARLRELGLDDDVISLPYNSTAKEIAEAVCGDDALEAAIEVNLHNMPEVKRTPEARQKLRSKLLERFPLSTPQNEAEKDIIRNIGTPTVDELVASTTKSQVLQTEDNEAVMGL